MIPEERRYDTVSGAHAKYTTVFLQALFDIFMLRITFNFLSVFLFACVCVCVCKVSSFIFTVEWWLFNRTKRIVYRCSCCTTKFVHQLLQHTFHFSFNHDFSFFISFFFFFILFFSRSLPHWSVDSIRSDFYSSFKKEIWILHVVFGGSIRYFYCIKIRNAATCCFPFFHRSLSVWCLCGSSLF